MALAHQFTYMNVQIGTVDFTGYLANTEQTASVPVNSEIGRATLTFLDDGSLPAIPRWGTVVISAGTAAPGTVVWGGYATRQSSEPKSISGGTARQVTVDCQSYAIALTTNAPISETYGGGDNEAILTDTLIVDDLAENYLPAFYDAASISSDSPIQCDYIQFSNETFRSALNKIGERGYKDYGISAAGKFYYRPTGSLGTLDHQLKESPDMSDFFPMQVTPYYDQDDVEVRNAVRVLGGWSLSEIQDESFTANGVVYEFQVAHFPQEIIRVTLKGIVQSVGLYLVDDPADFDCLVWYDQRKFIYQLPPGVGQTLEILYRYPVRVEENVYDAASIAAIGGTLWAQAIEDSSISDGTVAQLVGSAYLARSTLSVDRGQISTTYVGTATPYLPGQLIQVSVESFGWDKSELEIQAVTMRFAPRPGGDGACLTYWDLDVGMPVSVGRTLGDAYIDAPDIKSKSYAPNIREEIIAVDLPTIDHGSGLTGLLDDDHTQYLLATGARTGASSQAQTFTSGIIGPSLKPASDSTTAVQIQNAAGTAVLTVDTSNGYVGINGAPSYRMHVQNITGGSPFGLVIDGAGAGRAQLRLRADDTTYRFDFAMANSGMAFVSYKDAPDAGFQNIAFNGAIVVFNASNYNRFSISDNEQGRWTNVGLVVAGKAYNPASRLHVHEEDNATNTVKQLLTLSYNSTGTPAAYFGSGIAFNLKSSTTADQPAATLNTLWADATHATRSAAVTINTVYQGSLTNVAKFGGTLGNVFNEDGNAWCDFRVEGDTSGNLFFVDASADSIGVGTNAPSSRLHVQVTDADVSTTRTVVTVSHGSTGDIDAGFGGNILLNLQSTTTAEQNAARIDATWVSATHASRKARLALYAYDASAAREVIRLEGDGTEGRLGFFATTAAVRQSHIADPSGGATVDAEARTAINSILSALETYGLLKTS